MCICTQGMHKTSFKKNTSIYTGLQTLKTDLDLIWGENGSLGSAVESVWIWKSSLLWNICSYNFCVLECKIIILITS